MTTCRELAADAGRAMRALAPGDDLQADESAAALLAIQDLVLELHEQRGPMTDVDVTADYVAGENERVRIQAGATVTVTLPNAVAAQAIVADDHGFRPTSPSMGSTGVADGRSRRAPRDGARVEIVGASQSLWFYRSDINSWVAAKGLTLDSILPINDAYRGHFAAKVAERLIESWPELFEPTASLALRIARANSALLVRPGVARSPVRAHYH